MARKKKRGKSKLTLLIVAIVAVIAFGINEGWFEKLGISSFDDIFSMSGLKEGEVSDAPFSVHVIDVGQSDSMLIKAPEMNILVDAGEEGNGRTICSYLESQGVEKIDLLIATHPHSDHIGDMDYVIKNVEVGKILTGEIPESAIPTTRVYENLLLAASDKGIKIKEVKPGDRYELGDGCVMTVLGPVEPFEDYNNNSIVCKIEYKDFSMIFGGDSSKEAEELLLRENKDLSADLMIVSHHGSSSSTTKAYLNAINPKYAIISCGKDNSYGHPHKETLEKLEAKNITVYRTDISGNILCETDGEKIEFSAGNAK